MKYLLGDLFRDVIDEAKKLDIWEGLTVCDQAEFVGYLLREYGSIPKETGNDNASPRPAESGAARKSGGMA